ncbi:MAG: alpha/beta fold hydrolase [Gammaproteobacteria bacterium]
MDPQEIGIVTPFGRFAAKRWGPPQGDPTIAVHGWLDNSASFDPLAPLLPELHLLALDLAGHGLSDHRPPATAYHLVDHVRDVLAVADALAWQQFGLLGHSLGAAIAALVAGTFPQRITRLVLIEGLGSLAGAASELPVNLARAIEEQLEGRKEPNPVYAAIDEVAAARQRAGDMSFEAARTLVTRALGPCEGGVTWRSDPRVRLSSPQRFTEAQVRAFMCRIKAPTLLVLGEQGMLATKYPQMLQRASCLADSEVAWLPGGHHLHMDYPQQVAAVIDDFLLRHRPGDASSSNR